MTILIYGPPFHDSITEFIMPIIQFHFIEVVKVIISSPLTAINVISLQISCQRYL